MRLLARVDAYVATLDPGDIVVSGGAHGVDTRAVKAAKRRGMRVAVYYPNWERGRGAGFARNVSIVSNSDAVAAFWDGVSRGTRHTIGVAMEKGTPLMVHTPDGIDDVLTNTTIRMFPRMWGSASAHIPVVPAPVGSECMGCARVIGAHDEGLTLPLLGDPNDAGRVAWHRACWMESVSGPAPIGPQYTDGS